MKQRDLAEKKHWDSVYTKSGAQSHSEWMPSSYDSLCLEHMLLSEIDRSGAKSVLEVGCGNSIWLPYLGKARSVSVAGLDYSEQGCELARQQLKIAGVPGSVFCGDLFSVDEKTIGSYDFVYSLGVVEHFSDLENVLASLLKFVKPGGVLLTEIPNMGSINGLLSWLYQPKLLAKHEIIHKRQLNRAYENLHLKNICSRYLGVFSLTIVAWGYEQRIPRADYLILPLVGRVRRLSDWFVRRLKTYHGSRLFAPFLYTVGTKQE